MQLLQLKPNEKKVIVLASLGGALEFYDFVIYVIFAPIISQIFFPETDSLASLIKVYAVLAIGYLIRPVGGVIFSHFGDKYGRKKTFIFSVALMAVPTVLIGLLPTYNQIGISSSMLLIFLRLLQGLSIGGEIPGALTFTCEHVNPGSRAVACGFIFACLNFGIFLGELISLLLNSFLSHEQLIAFGWRIPFIFGGLLGIFSVYIRKQLSETPLFIAFKNSAESNRLPFMEAITLYWRKILQGMGITCLGSVVINLLFLYMPTYLSSILTYPQEQANMLNTLNLAFYSLLLLVFSWLGDRFGRKRILFMGAFSFILLSYFLFVSLAMQSMPSLIMALVVFAILSSSIMVYPSLLVELFPVSIRYTGIAISYNLAFAFFGGLTPMIVTYLIESYKSTIAPSFYLMFTGLLCFITLLSIKKLHTETTKDRTL